jgi:hypothetical protein
MSHSLHRTWLHVTAMVAVRRCALAGLLSWFVLDSTGWIASGTSSAALFNIPVLLVAVGPLWVPVRKKDEDHARM